MCHIKLKKFDSACQDCRRSLDVDPSLIKGHFFLGLSLLELESFDECIKHLQRAQDLSKEQKLNFGDDITSQIRMARKKRFCILEDKRITQEIELQTYLNNLICDDMAKKIEINMAKLNSEDNNVTKESLQEETAKIERDCVST